MVIRPSRVPVSARVATGSLMVLLAASVATILVFAVAVGSGTSAIHPVELVRTLTGGGAEESRFVVWELRLPRLVGSLLIGGALVVSGLIFQSVTRNPLVAPDTMGINSGAALAVVTIIVLGGDSGLITPAALAGGLLTAAVLTALSWKGGVGRYRFVLVGIGVAAFLEAGISFLLTAGDRWEVSRSVQWMLGSLYNLTWRDVAVVALGSVVLGALALALSRGLTALQLGDDMAAAIGVRTGSTRLALLLVAVALASLCVAIAGPIAFVAFVAPHMARRLARASGAGLIPATAVIGGLLLLGADTIARALAPMGEMGVGIITIALGAPWFLWLLLRADRLGAAA